MRIALPFGRTVVGSSMLNSYTGRRNIDLDLALMQKMDWNLNAQTVAVLLDNGRMTFPVSAPVSVLLP